MDLAASEALWTDFPDQWRAVLVHAKHVAASDFDAGLAALHAVPRLGPLVEAEADAEAALAAPPDDEWLCHQFSKWLAAVGGLKRHSAIAHSHGGQALHIRTFVSEAVCPCCSSDFR